MARSLAGTPFQEQYDNWLYGLLIWYRDQHQGNWMKAVDALGLHYSTVFKWVQKLEAKGFQGLNMTRSMTDAG